jgi:hypothetical protein
MKPTKNRPLHQKIKRTIIYYSSCLISVTFSTEKFILLNGYQVIGCFLLFLFIFLMLLISL